MEKLIESLINAGPVGLLAAGELLAIVGLVVWLRSVYAVLGAIQERRVAERDAVVTALKSAADGLDDVARVTPEVLEKLGSIEDLMKVIKDMILPDPEPLPRKRRQG